jgi:hypothetical protein
MLLSYIEPDMIIINDTTQIPRQTHTHTVIFYCNGIDTNLVRDYTSILTSVI